jgi:hypothetical protein
VINILCNVRGTWPLLTTSCTVFGYFRCLLDLVLDFITISHLHVHNYIHLQSFIMLCHIYTAYNLTHQYSILDVFTYTSDLTANLWLLPHSLKTLVNWTVEVEVTLRLTVSQSVSLSVEPHLGLITRYILLFDNYGLALWGALSDERTGLFFVCCGPLPAQSFSGPSPLGLATVFYSLRFETSLFIASYDSQGHGGGIRPRLHTGEFLYKYVWCSREWGGWAVCMQLES